MIFNIKRHEFKFSQWMLSSLFFVPIFLSSLSVWGQSVAEQKKSEFESKVKPILDFRYRHQSITETIVLGGSALPERRTHTIMTRFGAKANLLEDLNLTLRLLTGSSPTSGSQTLGDEKAPGSPRRTIGLDLAYGEYMPIKEVILFVGRMPQFFYSAGKNQVLLDRELALEGFGSQVKFNLFDDRLPSQLSGGSFWIREKFNMDNDSKDNNDTFLNIAQLNTRFLIDENWSVAVNTGIFSYTDIKDGKTSHILSGLAQDASRGNTMVQNPLTPTEYSYAYNYETTQNSVELNWKKASIEGSLFFESLKNTSAAQKSDASIYGVQFSWGSFSASYLNQKVDADAVFSLFTDSDAAGGETAYEGTIISLTYKFSKHASLTYSLHNQMRKLNTTTPNKYERGHLDLVLSY